MFMCSVCVWDSLARFWASPWRPELREHAWTNLSQPCLPCTLVVCLLRPYGHLNLEDAYVNTYSFKFAGMALFILCFFNIIKCIQTFYNRLLFSLLGHWFPFRLCVRVHVLKGCLSDGLGLCVWAPHLTCPRQSHVHCLAKKPFFPHRPRPRPQPGQLESKLPANGSTACTCQFSLDKQSNRTHTHVVSLTHLVIFLWKKRRKMRENGREMKRGSCAPWLKPWQSF